MDIIEGHNKSLSIIRDYCIEMTLKILFIIEFLLSLDESFNKSPQTM